MNVYLYEKQVHAVRITEKLNAAEHVTLRLLLHNEGNSHYCLITSMSRLLLDNNVEITIVMDIKDYIFVIIVYMVVRNKNMSKYARSIVRRQLCFLTGQIRIQNLARKGINCGSSLLKRR